MFNLFKKHPIVPGDCWIRKDNEFLSTIVRVEKVGKRNVLCRYLKINGNDVNSYMPIEINKSELRSDYWCNVIRPKEKE